MSQSRPAFSSDSAALRRMTGSARIPEERPARFLHTIFILVPFLLVVGLIVFRDFVFGGRVLLYKDVGSDSLNIFYPYFLHFSDYLRSIGIPTWSFNAGMGQGVFLLVGYLLFEPVTWLPRNLIAEALVYQHLLKIVVVGALFSCFLRLRGLTTLAAATGGLLLSFSAYMCMGSCWYVHADEVIAYAFVLFAVENVVTTGRWIYLPFAIGLLGLIHVFQLYLVALLLCVYVPLRLILSENSTFLPAFKLCARLAVVAVLGLGVGAVVWLDSAVAVLNSPRGSGMVSYASPLRSSGVFHLEERLHYFTVIYRSYANDLLGVGNVFRGWRNYLEAPMSYCGLVCLLLLPQIFVGARRRQRLVCATFVCLVALPILFPWFRYLFWLFQGDYYRVFSLFYMLGLLTLSMTAFSRYIRQGVLDIRLLGVTLIVLLLVLFAPLRQVREIVGPGVRQYVAVLLVAYAVTLFVGHRFRLQKFCAFVVLIICVVELCKFDRITTSSRATLTREELNQRTGYNDYTVDAIRDIKSADQGFYRISKLYHSGPSFYDPSLNDGMVFGYYGFSSYSSFNNVNYIRFLTAVEAIPRDPTALAKCFLPGGNPNEVVTRFADGVNGNPWLATFACEKYLFTTQPDTVSASIYDPVARYESIHVFRNKLNLPLGLFYSRFIRDSEFMSLTAETKERLVYIGVTVPETERAITKDMKPVTIDDVAGVNGRSMPELVADRAVTTLKADTVSQNRIDGTIQCGVEGILLFQMPFDPGWKAFVDGRRMPIYNVDRGLIGLKLTPGEHAIRMRYRPPLLAVGGAVSLVSLLLVGLMWWRWPRSSFLRA